MPFDRTRKSLRHEVLQKARELARSGRFKTYHAVEGELRHIEGFAAAQRWFKDPNFRAQITKLCEQAKEAPTGPKGQKRPGDVVGNGIKIAPIATGQEEEEFMEGERPKNEAGRS